MVLICLSWLEHRRLFQIQSGHVRTWFLWDMRILDHDDCKIIVTAVLTYQYFGRRKVYLSGLTVLCALSVHWT